ncbi:TonB-dependent receptor [Sphingomonas sp. TREG-RG-20F-R18-01]|uniref:TonB-dependent receptor domain-containing protein n=1 Tax=Sphingomonas sp. TREG-RG-20F-R18-01 TaxID=2914982 RepID=UPI001F55E24D|nr:TonB-dependent receptor [Sphingomonas sp. TREG-RG-20F-R18-01]
MASGGSSRLSRLGLIRTFVAIAACVGLPGHAIGQTAQIHIAVATLDQALTQLARQTGTDIVSTEPGLRHVPARRLSGRLAPAEALRRLLKGTGYRAVPIDARGFRIVRAPVPLPVVRAGPARTLSRAAPAEGADIIVTASKQQSPLLRFPGSAIMLGGFAPGSRALRPIDMDDLTRATPVLQNTELGVGRNKIFIRGVADSSFNGATQSTANQYFDEVPLGFAGPEPSLNLYDMRSVEVLEGPQGTLYGAGAIGGIIRLTPNPVDLARTGAAMTGGVTLTDDGAPGFDLAGMANVPIARDTAGLRVVGYRQRAGGYIDDPSRRLTSINRTDTLGGRVTLAADAGNGWTFELGALGQQIDAADAQYAEAGAGSLQRRSQYAQPYTSTVKLVRGVVRKRWDSGLNLVSATGYVDLKTDDTFDATRALGSVGPVLYRNVQTDTLFVQETRLSRPATTRVGWLLGVSYLNDSDVQSRALGPPGQTATIIGVTNRTESLSGFGEATWPVTPSFALTAGARLTTARTDGEPSVRPRNNSFIRGRATRRIDPTLALSWLVAPRTAVFAKVQSGYRTGGLAVASGVGRVADYRSDSIIVGEAGIRRQRRGETGLEVSGAVSHARWRDIQADLYSRRGQPYTANIGNAGITAIEALGDWVPVRGLHANFAFLYTYNLVDGALAQLSKSANRRLPETPPFAGNAGLSYQWLRRGAQRFDVGVQGRYVGRSVLGTGDFLELSQGQYAAVDSHVGWRWRNLDLTLSGENLTNVRANRFALGNPLILATRAQTTPLRPRSIRIGASVAW